jgi:hypothetical protein
MIVGILKGVAIGLVGAAIVTTGVYVGTKLAQRDLEADLKSCFSSKPKKSKSKKSKESKPAVKSGKLQPATA